MPQHARVIVLRVNMHRLAMSVTAPCRGSRVFYFPARFKKDTPLLRAVRRRWCQRTRHRGQAPFLNVGLNKDEASLAKVDVDDAWSVSADCWEEVLILEAMYDIFKLLAVTGEEYGSRARPVPDADDVALHNLRAVLRWCERLVISPDSV